MIDFVHLLISIPADTSRLQKRKEKNDSLSISSNFAEGTQQPSPHRRAHRLPAENPPPLAIYRARKRPRPSRIECADFSYAGVGGWIRRKPHLDPMVRQSVYTSSSH